MNLNEAYLAVQHASGNVISAVGLVQSAIHEIEKANDLLAKVKEAGIPLESSNGCVFPTTSAAYLNMLLNAYGKGEHLIDGLNDILASGS